MKIILSPAKELDRSKAQAKDWQLSTKSQKIVDRLQNLNTNELQASLNLTDKQVSQVQDFIADFDREVSYPAIQLYHGLAFRQFLLDDLTPSQTDYLKDHVRILSALYGPIQPFTPIKAYRLDFTMPLRVEGQSLRQYWKGDFDQAFRAGETVINLASQEYASMLQRDRYQWIDIEFYRYQQGQVKKAPSATAKKLRGLMANALVHDQVDSLEAVKHFEAEGFSYDASSSKADTLVFIQGAEEADAL
ncbi:MULTISPECIES: peroxide stress protein YaaA [Aerococcus]|uniref:UPF0246 protein F6I03_07790 n=1 Tax=Aerococcus sanguinicola TaxID=119206 RepID=A0A5N1GH81_9LACT|nr:MULTISPECIES: peroxide stress protein YaaA [Aerococcus]KAA9300325.1 peroxide stress protein YaaA [Aerococcus sanguinicola]MDK6369872.1 peroxide stress protein YaaA [Aerococcus sp. UMB9870]MDK6678852.1 peroxide stress protein YaaA [Aerococcus sp. UMB8608]MDK6686830.1 peroxide stress protein YaaA [Aerococcus sp. UMB8623]MDK6939510.1 peroxide stress protein YaaA [Aerococcus sp. UMB8487]